MNIPPGTLLITNSTSEADFFERTVVLVAQENENGHTGFVINKIHPRKLNELQEFCNSPHLDLYHGGPVVTDRLFFIHSRPDVVGGGLFIADNFYLGGNFTQAIEGIQQNLLTEKDVRLFIGYCGWDAHQLEEEITQGEWKINHSNLQQIFSNDTSMLWYTLL